MKKFLTMALAGVVVLGIGSVAYANICAFDPVPAASLLFPFVVFDYNNPTAGANTLLAITNVSSEAQIVHVTIWSDYSYPVLDFNIVLSGYDVQTMSIRDILHYGVLPVTYADSTNPATWVWGDQPPTDGPVSHLDGDWLDDILPPPEANWFLEARCPPTSSAYPGNYSIGLDSDDLDTLEFYFVASQASNKMHNDCLGTSYTLDPTPDWWELRDDSMATWVYVTADVVFECNRLFPDSPTYWTDQAMYQNVLMGDVMWVDDLANFSEADNAVHLEADLQLGNVATVDGLGNPISFYYRYSVMNNVTPDYREPLPTAWAVRYMGVGSAAIDTHVRAWKGSTFLTTIADLHIPTGFYGTYLAYDCLAYSYWAWDEDENVSTVDENPWSIPGVIDVYPNLLPLETQEVLADEFNTPGSEGWFLFVWPNSNWDNIPGAPA
ncbi:MAG: hypothetical protein GY842_14190, partial [bacterium]|nr:hypothetical protein [bacterium]